MCYKSFLFQINAVLLNFLIILKVHILCKYSISIFKQQKYTVFNINKTFFILLLPYVSPNQHIKMISEGTEDWNNVAENSALPSQE